MKTSNKKQKILIFIVMLFIIININNISFANFKSKELFNVKIFEMLGDSFPTSIKFNDEYMFKALKSELGTKAIFSDSELTITITEENINSITSLDLSDNDIVDITGIENFKNLENLNLSKNNINTISNIQGLTNIKTLNISYNGISEISPITNLTNLETLNMESCNVSNIDNLKGLINLKDLNIAGNKYLSSLVPLRSLTKIENLNISNMSVRSDDSISSFSNVLGLANLKTLVMRENRDINTLEINSKDKIGIYKLTNLETLDIYGCNVTNLAPLTTKSDNKYCLLSLKILNVGNNGLGSKGLNLTSLTTVCSYLTNIEELYAANNAWGATINSIPSNIYNLKELKILNFANCNILCTRQNNPNVLGKLATRDKETGEICLSNLTEVSLQENEIEYVNSLAELTSIKILNLERNTIHTIPYYMANNNYKELNLREQDINFNIYYRDKSDGLLQQVITPSIIQYSTAQGNNLSTSEELTINNCTINSNKDVVTIDCSEETTIGEDSSITINGGILDGSTITYNVSKSTTAVEALAFKDENMYNAVINEIIKKFTNKSTNELTCQYFSCLNKNGYHLINIFKTDIDLVTELNAPKNGIKDISEIKRMVGLNKIILYDNEIEDIDDFKYLKRAQEINLSSNKIKDISPLSNLNTNLTLLNLNNNEIEDITPLGTTNKLIRLEISNNKITSIEPLKNLTKMTDIDLSTNKIKSIAPLEQLTMIKNLSLSDNGIEDLDKISNLTEITNLKISNINSEKLDAIVSLKKITVLDASRNNIKNIDVLKNLTSLTNLDLAYNHIEDIKEVETLLGKDGISVNLKYQTILKTITSAEANSIQRIDLPKILLSALDSSSIAYSEAGLTYSNCAKEDNKVKIDNLGTETATVTINKGDAKGTRFLVSMEIDSRVVLTPAKNVGYTNEDVTAIINFSKKGVIITNNDGKNTYTFTENGSFTFQYKDENDVYGEKTISVDYIDKVKPTVKGIENGKNYLTTGVTPSIEEVGFGIKKATIKKDNQEISYDFKDENNTTFNTKNQITEIGTTKLIGTTNIREIGIYEISVEDFASNITTIQFKITNTQEDSNDIPGLKNESGYSIKDEKYITKIFPKTKIKDFKDKKDTEYTMLIKNSSGVDITDDTKNIGTGMQIVVKKDSKIITYTAVITGDCTGNGEIEINDIFQVNKHRLNKNLLINAFKLAADVDNNDKININDIFIINKNREK